MNIENTAYNQSRRDDRVSRRTSNLVPSRYVFILTNKCNLACSFCFQDRTGLPNAMKTEDWIATIDKLPDGSHITLTGGEPLAFKGFEEVFNYACKRHSVNIISNGVLLNKRYADLFLSQPKLLTLSISIDTIGNLNRDVKQLWYEKMLDVLKYIKEKKRKSRNFDLVIDAKTVVVEENIEDLPKIYEHCVNELFIDSHSIQFLKGSPIQHADKMFVFDDIFKEGEPYMYENIEGLANSILELSRLSTITGVPSYSHPSWFSKTETLEEILAIIKNEVNIDKFTPAKYQKCGSPWESAHINADGKLFPCLAVDFGDIRNFENLEDMFHKGMGKQFRDIIFKCGSVNACNRCGYLLLEE